MRKNTIVIFAMLVMISAVIVYTAIHRHSVPSTPNREIEIDPQSYYLVKKVVDGDTFRINVDGRTATVRMLGIDTPETVDPRKQKPDCYGLESSEHTKSLLQGAMIRLEFNPDREKKDYYGRFLAYAYTQDGLLVNEHLIREGYAREYTVGEPYSMQQIFRLAQKDAQLRSVGIWEHCETS